MIPKSLTRREFVAWAARAAVGGGAATFLSSCSRKPRTRSFKFLNAPDYIAKDTVRRFEKESGISVACDYYVNEHEMTSKLAAQLGDSDLVVAPDQEVFGLRHQKLIAALPKGTFDYRDRIVPELRNPEYDPGLTYTIPYLWGISGIGYNTKHVTQPPSSWKALWDEKYKGRISMLDSYREALQVALLLLGLPGDTGDPSELKKAGDVLSGQRRLLAGYNSTSYASDLASGKLWLAQGWNGDILRLKAKGAPIDFVLPEEGALMWVDGLCLSSSSDHVEDVARFVEFLMRPEVAAEISQTTCYATPNAKALELLSPSFRSEPRVFPSAAARSKLRLFPQLSFAAKSLWAKTWEQVRT